MIGIIVVTHSQLATALLQTAEMIIGPVPNSRAVSIDRSCSVEEATRQVEVAIGAVASDDEGVLILTDLFGGTPTNICAEFLAGGKVEILTGVNLPAVIKAASARQNMTLESLAAMLKDYGKQAIMMPSELLKGAR